MYTIRFIFCMFLSHGGKLPLCRVAILVCFGLRWAPAPFSVVFLLLLLVAKRKSGGGFAGRLPLRLFGFVLVFLFELPMQFLNGTTAFHAEFLIRLTCLYQFQDRALERHRPSQRKKGAYWGGAFLRACFFLRFEVQKGTPSLPYCFAP